MDNSKIPPELWERLAAELSRACLREPLPEFRRWSRHGWDRYTADAWRILELLKARTEWTVKVRKQQAEALTRAWSLRKAS